jgi:hypothetical protein
MKYSTQVKPVSYLKANAAEVIRTLSEQREPMIITQKMSTRLPLFRMLHPTFRRVRARLAKR